MVTTFPGFSSPAAGFDQPLQMLAACHERVATQLSTLRRLAAHLRSHGADQQAREAAQAILRYFDISARHHHADEDVDLFPALLESMAGSDAVCLRALTEGLSAEHRKLEAQWQTLRVLLVQIAEGQSLLLDEAEVGRFIERYETHIALENGELLPMAERLLSDGDLARLGAAMRQRRNHPA